MKNRLLEFIHEGVVITGEDFVILDFNEAFKSFFSGFNVDSKTKVIEILSFPKMELAFIKAIKGEVFREEVPVYFGKKRLECLVSVFMQEEKIYWIFYDMTNFKALQNAKVDFVSAVSHEFMTPLGVIEGFLSIIDDANMKPSLRKKYINRAMAQLKRLEKLVDQLLSLSELEMKKYTPEFSRVNLSTLLFEAKEEMAYRWKSKNIEVKINCPEEIHVKTDENALMRILTNLLSNAIKYSFESSEVTMDAQEKDRCILISVKDHGVGIKEEEIPRIFERFYRASNSSKTGAKGMGLGLSLVKHLCDVIKAEIDVKSQYMLGSTFTLKIPKDV